MPKSRTIRFGNGSGFRSRREWRAQSGPSYPWINDPWSTPSVYDLGYRVEQLLLSQGNPAPYGSRPQNGGDFLTKSYERRMKPSRMNLLSESNSTLRWRNIGLIFPNNPGWLSGLDPRSWLSIKSTMIAMGTKGWNRFSPGSPIASLSQFIGELRQLPRDPFKMAREMVQSIRRARSNTVGADILRRSVGDHYLNWSFGWRPFLQDLEKISQFNEELFRSLDQLYRDHGKVVRRRGTIESTSTTTVTVDNSGSTGGYMPQIATNKSGGSRRTVTTIVKDRYWFSAGFTFRMPNVNDSEAMSSLRQYLQGGGISPSVVWELTPWSWLADYFTSIGDSLENWEKSRAINLAAKYAYVMHKRDITTVSQHQSWAYDGSFSLSASATSRAITQARTGASAYGFGFTTGALNNAQIANLVALGLSRRV